MADAVAGQSTAPADIVIDPAAPWGYTRSPALQQRFEQAAAALLASDGWQGELVADLALEGGGVKGIGIVGAASALAEAGYRFQRVAGSSAGAIAAALIAAIAKKGERNGMQALHGYLDNLTFTEFMPQGKLHAFMDHHFGQTGELLSDADVLTRRMGVYSGDYLFTWLGPIMNKTLGVTTFEDLKITPEEDPGMSLPENKRYRLVVHTSDITRGQLVQLPWDYGFYGRDRRQPGRGSGGPGLHVHPVLFRTRDLRRPSGRRERARPGRS